MKTTNSLSIDLYANNLPNGSYDDIFIICINVDYEKDIYKENKCDIYTKTVKCTCNNLNAGTQYKIKFITRKQGWDDAIFEYITIQYLSNSVN